MGALEFAPAIGPAPGGGRNLRVGELVALASEVLTERADLVASLDDAGKAEAMKDILRVGTSAGGARAKAVIAWNPAPRSSGPARSTPGPASSTGCSSSTASTATATRSSTIRRATASSSTPTPAWPGPPASR